MKILHFADLHLGVENYGRIDPATGLSTRLLDILTALDQLVDYAISNKIDLVLFCGDAYKSREPSQTHQREFARRISRLSDAGVPVFLLIGNHDLPNAAGRATSTEIFSTLAVKNVYVSNHPEIVAIPTCSGIIQVASLPWIRRSLLLSKEETKTLNIDQINQRLQESLTGIIANLASKLNPSLPSILAAHVWVGNPNRKTREGTEKAMTLGQEHSLLVSNVANPVFDYVALGHIHIGQVINENPPVIYSGSLERLDFGDEKDEKGFYVIDIEPATGMVKRHVGYEFHPVKGRQFVTINIALEPDNVNPTESVVQAIQQRAAEVKDAIVRMQLSLPAEIDKLLHDAEIRDALKEAYHFTVSRDIKRETRSRLGNWSAEEIKPAEALKLWLETKKVSPERSELLLYYGSKLIENEPK